MKASVVIPTKNPGLLFQQVLERVLLQVTDFAYEVLVIDSGSQDGTVEYIQGISNDRLSLIEIAPDTFGHGRTRNLGVASSSGEYVALITHDALPADNQWLAKLVAMAESDNNIAGVFGRHIAYPDASPFTRREIALHFDGFSADPVVSMDSPERYKEEVGYRQFLHFFSDNNALIRRSVWESIPYPDVNFAEDQLWAKQIIEAGFKKAFADEAAVYHSHNYTLRERLQRSFDESLAFKSLFGYRLCPGIKDIFRTSVALTRRDLSYALKADVWRTDLATVLVVPLDNMARLTGYYLGGIGNSLPQYMQKTLSWGYKLMAGLRKYR